MIDPKQVKPNPNLAEPAWFISWLTGNDTNAGTTLGAPLKTFAELFRRLGSRSPGGFGYAATDPRTGSRIQSVSRVFT